MYFTTATILNWQNLLAEEKAKDIVIGSLQHLSTEGKLILHGFVIMPNHIHLLATFPYPHTYDKVLQAFKSYTGHEFKKYLIQQHPERLAEYTSTQADRNFHFWERRPRSIKIESERIAWQKLDYMHYNPVKAGLSSQSEDYHYSSASFYLCQTIDFKFLVHHADY